MTDLDGLRAWIGRTETVSNTLSPATLDGLAALLDHGTPPWTHGEVPPLGHWLYFLPHARQSEIDTDGHAKRGGFLPPVPLPRRMWAGGRLDFHAPLPTGAEARRVSTIADVRHKRGATGNLVFVTIRHAVSVGDVLAVTEEQDLVYREDNRNAAKPRLPDPPTEPAVADAVRTVVPDAVQLFRFSALTFNAHRIHYDREYARGVEGYDGLVVHGPYLATLLLDHFRRTVPGRRVTRFSFRALAPVLDTAPFDLCLARTAEGARLWVRTASGQVAMTAEIHET
jgi:3-methylfumaryl-CoA hydratase